MFYQYNEIFLAVGSQGVHRNFRPMISSHVSSALILQSQVENPHVNLIELRMHYLDD